MSFRLIQITDCHLFADQHKTIGEGILGRGVAPFDTLVSVLNITHKYSPDMVLITGDLSADETEQSYQHFKQLWQQVGIKSPMMMIPGNHDNAVHMKSCFPESFWESEVVRASNWRMHGLHSQVPGQGQGNVNDEQLYRVQADIEQYPDAHHFIAVHHHPVAMNSWMDKYHWINKDAFVDFVERHEAIKLVIHGHVHAPRDILLGQARLLATPSTCWQFNHEAEFSYNQGAPAMRMIDLHQDGRFDTSIVRVEPNYNEH